uniref:Coiled-coil domain containing 170 n=1 Tax=Sphaeramia orbicularis TaxID=375764 RepID=A0A672YFD9_9TELE
MEKRSVESEKQTLTERLEAAKRVIEAARSESECLDKQLEEVHKKLQTSQDETQKAEGNLQTFLQKAAAVLQGNSDDAVLPTEDNVLHTVDSLCNKVNSKLAVRHHLQLSSMQAMLSEQTELHHKALQRAQLAEEQVQDLRKRLQCAEMELLTAHMHRDRLRLNNQHYEEFLEQVSATLKVESIAVDLGSDMRLKLILSRAEQLVKQEGTALVESKSMTCSLQRKLKSQKDQLESKGLHVQLLRKKVSELEEERRSRSALAVERDDAQLEIRRLLKKVERLQAEMRTTKASNTELRAQLVHTNELKNQTVQEQKKKLDQLEGRKAKVEKKLSTVSSDLKSQEKKSREEQQQLSSLRQSLDQLLDRQTAVRGPWGWMWSGNSSAIFRSHVCVTQGHYTEGKARLRRKHWKEIFHYLK